MKKFIVDAYKTDTPSSYPTKNVQELFEAILSISTQEEAANFFRDLFTMAEIKEFSNRWQMVKLLTEGKSYLEIANTLKTSTTTVSRVAHWLHEGSGGYQAIISRIWAKKHQKPKISEAERTVHNILRLRK
jgi:TrpR-related protein YerC/YecD